MTSIKQFLVFIIALFLFQASEAAENKITLEPLVGMETVLVRYPEPPSYLTRATYGARVLYGTTPLSAELEYTEAQSRKDYTDSDQKVFDKSQRASVGIRSTYGLGDYLGIYGRIGGRASQGKTEITTGSLSEIKDHPLVVNPYAGAGLQLAFSSILAVNAGVTLIRNSEDKYDSQYTLGLTARFGNP